MTLCLIDPFFDAWNVTAELNATNNGTIRSYVWGTDLSGSFQGAGGVGGLLKLTYNGIQTTNCFIAFDGNGNVSGLVDAANGTVIAQYEYGPFGEVIRATGPMAKTNPFRFSTKYQDDQTDLLYYGYRYYCASTGRWLNRDLIAERDSPNLYNFVRNAPLSRHDVLGKISSQTMKYYYDAEIDVTASIEPSNPDNPCLGGFLKFNVHFEANTPPDSSYMSQAHFFYGCTEVPYTGYGPASDGWVKFDVPYQRPIPACPVGKQSGTDIFTGTYAYGKDISGGLGIVFDWSYKCDECCNTKEPFKASFRFEPFGGVRPL